MSVETVSLFLALLAAASTVVVIAAAVLWLLRRSTAVERARTDAVEPLRPIALALAAVVAGVATAGSLYYSEVAGFPPCRLCWVQRGFMYPLAVVVGVAAWRGLGRVRAPARAWALLGAAVSTWHLLVERFPSLEGAVACDPTNPCSLVWVRELGVFSIPAMALAGFLLVAVLLSIAPAQRTADESVPSAQEHR